MRTRIQKWGNSQGLRLPKDILQSAQLGVGDEVQIAVRDDCIIITPSKTIRGRYRIEDLVAGISEDHQSREIDFGAPAGKEEW
jgi:antitoxin MazE